MKEKTDLASVKSVAVTLLVTDYCKTKMSPAIIQYPFTNTGFVQAEKDGIVQLVDITKNDADFTSWQNRMRGLIENAKKGIMKLIYRIFHQNPESREGVITVTSLFGAMVNLLIAALKIVVGALASSIAIISEGANNATDALSSVMTLIGTKIAGKHPDPKHPFGYRRVEYLTGLAVAVFILVTGIEMLISSVRRVFVPEELHISYLAIGIVAVSAVAKFFLGLYTIRMGKKTGSSALEAVGKEGRNDSFTSGISIASSLIFVLFGISLDAYAGILISALILKAGFDAFSETLAELIGRAGEKELADRLYREIRGTRDILGASDMMLHNYGPDIWSGSVNVEIDHRKTVGEAYRILRELQLKIMREYAVTMIFGIYGVNNDRTDYSRLRPIDYPIMEDFYRLCEDEFKHYDKKKKNLYTEETLTNL